MRFVSLFSGGKDSTYALWYSLNQGWDCSSLLSIYPKKDSYLFHWPNIQNVEPMAEAMDLPLTVKQSSKDELDTLRDLLSKTDAEAVVAGAVASEYQRVRVEEVCEELGLKSFMPLWHKNSLQLWKDMLDADFKVMITGVSADGLTKDWLGRIMDERALNELVGLAKKHRLHLIGEGGEFETLVVECPLFKQRVKFELGEQKWDGSSGWIDVKAKVSSSSS